MLQESLEKSAEFARAVKDKKVVASTMVRYKEKPADALREVEFAEALHFNYDDGTTIRTIFNLSRREVVKVETLEAYPTPLADEEVEQALDLAMEKSVEVRSLLEKFNRDRVKLKSLAPVIADKKDKRYGKRIAILSLMPKEVLADSVSVTVNLTEKTVSNE
jgi:replicative superfamily II helicase